MRDQLRALGKLAQMDEAARDLDVELKEIPRRLGELRQDVDRLESLLARERNQLTEAEALSRSHGEQIASNNEALARARQKGAKARNAREVEAAEREMDTIRRTIKEREEEQVRLAAAIEKVRGSLGGHEKEFESLRAMLRDEDEKARARIAELQTQRDKVLVGRDVVVAKIPRDVLSRYERVREKRGTGLALVTDPTCPACRMAIRPQAFVILQRGDALDQCPSCNRMQIYKPLVDD